MDFKQTVFPRWRGFNILGMFCSSESCYNDFRSPGYFIEEDFKMMADWGFDFVRLPISYRLWSDVKNPYEINEENISRLDEAIYFAEKYGLHTNIAMHRLPGYCVNQDEKIEEKIEAIKGGLEGVCIGEVLTCEKHPDADKLHVTTVNVGADEPLQIVCGAPNVAAGEKVVVATIGAQLYPTGQTEPFKIKKSKIAKQS